ncbi:MAG: hypothetical protein FJY95_08155 [Candidatus Handelsmanbacteria bacterium]|nr:hypothetical protein [Candidatus Handelsmanbacteria bacterium]
MGKYSLIVIAGFVAAFGWIRANLNEVNGLFSENFLEFYDPSASPCSRPPRRPSATA